LFHNKQNGILICWRWNTSKVSVLDSFRIHVFVKFSWVFK